MNLAAIADDIIGLSDTWHRDHFYTCDRSSNTKGESPTYNLLSHNIAVRPTD
ncbi:MULTISPECIES: hypothetical protein [unclassified Nostoc]|uniref:hypothetical protein n=1 Tax=unclassified Nostoc TaxID=2593658 RepID=UPI0016728A47|nr:hypothetical protein [Nostoc sp. 'Peltigera membranacea cyanobiont' 232]